VGIKVMAATAMMALGEGCGPASAVGPIDGAVTAVPASVEDVTLAGPLLARPSSGLRG